ncbi:MAG: ABC transporter permease subunit [Oscillospiraceae bacterium]|nr:ABC transporter permease subunit [Oscillospiraceae bacterium]
MDDAKNIKIPKIPKTPNKQSFGYRAKRDFKMHFTIYMIALFCLSYYAVFSYAPMGGIVIAFKNYKPMLGLWGSEWVGLRYFEQFFSSYYIFRLIRNTFLINLYELFWAFPAPIIFALLLNELTSMRYKRVVQTVTYLPHFISQVIICGILLAFLRSDGLFNQLIMLFGGDPVLFMQNPGNFRTIYIASGIWQGVGYGTILYLSSLGAVDPQLLDAAAIDGCNRFRRIWHVTLPGIAPTIIIMLILRMGSMMSVGFEKIILLYNPAIYETSDVISSFVYRYGLLEGNFSYSAAVGLFNSVVNFTMLIIVNYVSKRVSEVSLW